MADQRLRHAPRLAAEPHLNPRVTAGERQFERAAIRRRGQQARPAADRLQQCGALLGQRSRRNAIGAIDHRRRGLRHRIGCMNRRGRGEVAAVEQSPCPADPHPDGPRRMARATGLDRQPCDLARPRQVRRPAQRRVAGKRPHRRGGVDRRVPDPVQLRERAHMISVAMRDQRRIHPARGLQIGHPPHIRPLPHVEQPPPTLHLQQEAGWSLGVEAAERVESGHATWACTRAVSSGEAPSRGSIQPPRRPTSIASPVAARASRRRVSGPASGRSSSRMSAT